MRLAFKNWGFGYTLKEVEIVINLASVELACEELKIDLFQMADYAKKNAFDYMTELLYAGYVIACQKRYKKPKYGKEKAIIWNENMSVEARTEFGNKINVFITGITVPQKGKKKVMLKRAG
jgi:hypothetical protein